MFNLELKGCEFELWRRTTGKVLGQGDGEKQIKILCKAIRLEKKNSRTG